MTTSENKKLATADSSHANFVVYLIFALSCISVARATDNTDGWHNGGAYAHAEGLFDYADFPRAKVADNGVNMHFSLLLIGQSIVEGGLEEKSELSASYDLQFYFDTAKLGWWQGGHVILRAEGKSDDNGVNPFSGALVPVNFDASVPEPEGVDFLLTEWSYTQEFADGKVAALAGMWDLGRFFDFVPFSGPYQRRFINAHMFANSVLLPYAPYNNLGGLIILQPVNGLRITTSISDPNSTADDLDWYAEGDFNLLHEWRLTTQTFGQPSIFNLGLAYQDKEVATLADPALTTSSNWSAYGSFSQWLYQNPANPRQAIGLFGRVGWSDGEVNRIKNHFSLGVSFDGVIPGRPNDIVALVGWHNDFSDDVSDTLTGGSSGLEIYYNYWATPWLEVSPDVQFLFDQGFASVDDALILGLRARVLF